MPKSHWIDAACVGTVERLRVQIANPLAVQCVGHGTRQICRTDAYGFPRLHKSRKNRHFGFQTGDMVKAVVTMGKVACRASGSFNVTTAAAGTVEGISQRLCTTLHKKDGYAYS